MVLNIQLLRVRDGVVVLDSPVAATDRGSEGMATTIPSNVDQLMNRVFRLVVYQVIDQVIAKLALGPQNVRVRITADP